MSLYQCEQCGCCENTATGKYWGHAEKLCSACGFGEWHGKFPRVFLAKGEFKTNSEGNLEHIASGSERYNDFAIGVDQ